MKILLFSRGKLDHSRDEIKYLLGMFGRHGLSWMVNAEFAQVMAKAGVAIPPEAQYVSMSEHPDADMVVCYGGDGTFLEAVRRLGNMPVPVLGINSGRLGFLANVPKDNVEQAMADIASGNYRIERRNLVRVEGDFEEQPAYPYAFNEFSVQRDGAGMISVDAFVDGEMVGRYWGDGLILSTPAGSTAYSLSVGGPIMAPGCECFVLAPIAPHNLTMRPVVLPDNCEVTFKIGTRDKNVFVMLDNSSFKACDGAEFRISKADAEVFLVALHNISFYDTLRNKLLWGLDRRDETK